MSDQEFILDDVHIELEGIDFGAMMEEFAGSDSDSTIGSIYGSDGGDSSDEDFMEQVISGKVYEDEEEADELDEEEYQERLMNELMGDGSDDDEIVDIPPTGGIPSSTVVNQPIINETVELQQRTTILMTDELPAHLKITASMQSGSIEPSRMTLGHPSGPKRTKRSVGPSSRKKLEPKIGVQATVSAIPSYISTKGPALITPISGITSTVNKPTDIKSMITMEPGESRKDFEFRSKFAEAIYNDNRLDVDIQTIRTYSKLMSKSIKYGIKYSDDVEKTLNYLKSYMINQ